MRKSSSHRLVATVAGLALLAGGCGDDGDTGEESSSSTVEQSTSTTIAPEGAQTMAISGTDFGFAVDSVPAPGRVDVTLTNDGEEEHHVNLLRVDGDAEAAAEAIADGDLSVLGQGTLVGGPGTIAAGEALTAEVDLAAGSYVAFCQIPSPDSGIPHSQQGMVTTFDVDGEEGSTDSELADHTVTIADDGYDVPADIASGRIEFTNGGSGPADASLLRLADGATADDVLAFLGGQPAGPPPFESAGGATGLSPGESTTVDLDLEPGTYVLLSFVPTPAGPPGFVTGQLTEFTVG